VENSPVTGALTVSNPQTQRFVGGEGRGEIWGKVTFEHPEGVIPTFIHWVMGKQREKCGGWVTKTVKFRVQKEEKQGKKKKNKKPKG